MTGSILDVRPFSTGPLTIKQRMIHRACECPEPGYRYVVTTPSLSPILWRNYLDGALANYRSHGVDRVLDYRQLADGASTSLFFAAVNADGHVISGVRAQGPYTSPEQSHAIAEWEGYPGQEQVRTMIAERLPYGVVEIKTGWVADSATHRHALADFMPRTAVHAPKLLGSRFAFATSALHTLKRWTTAGAEIVPTLAPVPYPDDRYRTSMLWLDRTNFAERADPAQLHLLLSESAQLADHDTVGVRRPLVTLGTR